MNECIRITHVVWADNVFLIAPDAETFAWMAQQVTDRLYEFCLEWKLESLQQLAGTFAQDASPVVLHTPGGGVLQFACVDTLLALGVALDSRGATETSLEHRLFQAQACYWKHEKAFRGRGSPSEKFAAWNAAPVASALHGSSSWALSKNLAVRLRR